MSVDSGFDTDNNGGVKAKVTPLGRGLSSLMSSAALNYNFNRGLDDNENTIEFRNDVADDEKKSISKKNSENFRKNLDTFAENINENELTDDNKNFRIQKIAIAKVIVNASQPRKFIDLNYIEELSKSIIEVGQLQPIIVRPIENGMYQIVAGERRYHAVKKAGLDYIIAVVRDLADTKSVEVAIIENIQRKDLSPLEEASAYKSLMEHHSHTQETLAKKLSKSRSYIANMLRLNGLPNEIKDLLNKGRITMGHARAILSSNTPIEVSREIIENNLNVRETEKLIKKYNKNTNSSDNVDAHSVKNSVSDAKFNKYDNYQQDDEIDQLADDLSSKLRMNISIKKNKLNYDIKISCKTIDDFDMILAKLNTKQIF